MYRSGFWIRSSHAVRLSKLLYRFLALYVACADYTLAQRKRRFAIVPKLHMLTHCAYDLEDQARRSEWCINPLSCTNQVQEDYIGRPSRISRRVSIRSLHTSLVMRSLIVYQESLRAADADLRGMDGYPDVWYVYISHYHLVVNMLPPVNILTFVWGPPASSAKAWHPSTGANVEHPQQMAAESWVWAKCWGKPPNMGTLRNILGDLEIFLGITWSVWK